MTALTPKYRFELLVPLFYNDGTPIESEQIDRVLNALIEQFGAYRYDKSKSTLPSPKSFGCERPKGAKMIQFPN